MVEKKIIKTKKKVVKKTPVKKATSKKTPVKKVVSKKTPAKEVKRLYHEAVGRRKTSSARVRIFTCKPFEDEKGKVIVNGKKYDDFFTTFDLRETLLSPLKRMKSINRFEVTIKIKGGGIKGQAEAARHGLSRALVKFNPDFSKKLKRAGFLTRDSRKKERKKPGLKKARKASQWKKR